MNKFKWWPIQALILISFTYLNLYPLPLSSKTMNETEQPINSQSEDSKELQELKKASFEKPQFLVFLRHFGCIFAKETAHDLSQLENQLKEKNTELVIVHMSSEEEGKTLKRVWYQKRQDYL